MTRLYTITLRDSSGEHVFTVADFNGVPLTYQKALETLESTFARFSATGAFTSGTTLALFDEDDDFFLENPLVVRSMA